MPGAKYYDWGGERRDITSLLREKRIYDLVPGTTWPSKREAIRGMLRTGKLTYDMVKDLPDLGTVEPGLYGAQRGRAGLALK